MSLPAPYYQDDWATIYHADCREVMAEMGDKSVDLVLTDPPYNVGVSYGEGTNDRRDNFTEWMRPRFLEMRRVSKAVVVAGQERLPDYALIERWKWLLCWHKPAAMGRSPVGFCNWEPMALWGKGTKNGNDFIRAPIIPDKALSFHPCPKPLLWARGFISLFDWASSVCDPFMGSGTVLVAAKSLNIKSIGIEIEEKFCEGAARRLQQEVFNFAPVGEP